MARVWHMHECCANCAFVEGDPIDPDITLLCGITQYSVTPYKEKCPLFAKCGDRPKYMVITRLELIPLETGNL